MRLRKRVLGSLMMSYTKFYFYVIATSVVFLNLAASFIQSGNFGKMQARNLTLEQLADDGPGSNAFVRLSDHCVAGEPVRVQIGKLNNFYVPLFTTVADSNAATPIRVVLRIDSTKSDQLPLIQKELADPKTRIEGLCYEQVGETVDHLFIEKQHERSALGAHVILYRSTPQLWELFLGLAIIVVVYAFYVLGTLLMCKSSGKLLSECDRDHFCDGRIDRRGAWSGAFNRRSDHIEDRQPSLYGELISGQTGSNQKHRRNWRKQRLGDRQKIRCTRFRF